MEYLDKVVWKTPGIQKNLFWFPIIGIISILVFYIISNILTEVFYLGFFGLILGAIGVVIYTAFPDSSRNYGFLFSIGFGTFIATVIYTSVGGNNFVIFGLLTISLLFSFVVGIMWSVGETQRRFIFNEPDYLSFDLHQELLKLIEEWLNDQNITYEKNGSNIFFYPQDRKKVIIILTLIFIDKKERNLIVLESIWKERDKPLTNYENELSRIIMSISNLDKFRKYNGAQCPGCGSDLSWHISNNEFHCNPCDIIFEKTKIILN